MPSPVPRHLRSDSEVRAVSRRLRDHVNGLKVAPRDDVHLAPSSHPAKYAPGLPTALVRLAGTESVGDPLAGTGRLAEETRIASIALNEIDPRWRPDLERLRDEIGCEVSFGDAAVIPWKRECLIFSPPYYPRTDRCRLAAHNDDKRGRVVGYRSGYGGKGIPGFIGDPCGVDGILRYREAMRSVYRGLAVQAPRMIVVVKNQTRLGVEMRLDLDTILTASEAGWRCVRRTGWTPRPSLWMRYNLARGTGVEIEDVLVFERA